jgi:hypothetical protein
VIVEVGVEVGVDPGVPEVGVGEGFAAAACSAFCQAMRASCILELKDPVHAVPQCMLLTWTMNLDAPILVQFTKALEVV